jgi:hypothetical protein
MRNPRIPSKLTCKSFKLERQLNLYALAATAAGVGMLALTQPAASEIIYTKTNRVISPKTTFHLDVNHDGVADIDLKDIFNVYTVGSSGQLTAIPALKKNHIWGHTVAGYGYASALYPGVRIGPKGKFLPGSGSMASSLFNGGRKRPPAYESCTGPWADVTKRYLGFEFDISGQMHFGWARLNVSCKASQVTAVLTGYAYETVPNRSIVTGREKGSDEGDSSSLQSETFSPEAASLGRLAGGTAGLAPWRKQR